MRLRITFSSALGVVCLACGGSDGGSREALVERGGETSGGNAGSGAREPTGEEPAGGREAPGGQGGAPAEPFCAALEDDSPESAERRCLDFDATGSAADFTTEAGTWSVEDGGFVVTGPESPATCAEDGTWMTAATLNDFEAVDVRVRAELTGITRADKIVVLRHRDPENRIELNFRANYETEGVVEGGDLVVQELNDCIGTMRIRPGELSIPHAIDDTITVEIELRGQRLVVHVDAALVLDTTFAEPNLLSEDAGSVGFGTIAQGSTRLDNLVVEALE